MNKNENPFLDLTNVKKEFDSDFIPLYKSRSFEIKNYSILRDNSDIIYSDPFIIDSIKWRLKIYPNGNGVSEGEYFSIFLEMVEGPWDS